MVGFSQEAAKYQGGGWFPQLVLKGKKWGEECLSEVCGVCQGRFPGVEGFQETVLRSERKCTRLAEVFRNGKQARGGT